MDPDKALDEVRRLVVDILEPPKAWPPTDPDAVARQRAADAIKLAIAVEKLDNWLSQKGFPPRDWQPPSPIAP